MLRVAGGASAVFGPTFAPLEMNSPDLLACSLRETRCHLISSRYIVMYNKRAEERDGVFCLSINFFLLILLAHSRGSFG